MVTLYSLTFLNFSVFIDIFPKWFWVFKHIVMPFLVKRPFYFVFFHTLGLLFISKNITLFKRSQAPKNINFIILSVLTSCKRHAKLIYGDRNQKRSSLWGREGPLSGEGPRGVSWDGRNVPLLHLDIVHLGIYIYQNSLSCTTKIYASSFR